MPGPLRGVAWTAASCLRVLFAASDPARLDAHARTWAEGIASTYGVRIEASGTEQLVRDRPVVLVANHQSLLDVVALFIALPVPPVFIAKRELARVPLFAQVMRTRGDIFIDRGAHDRATQTIESASHQLQPGRPLLVFPEGTRGRTPEVHHFKRGAFDLAKKAGACLQPVGIRGSFEAWPRERKAPSGGVVKVAVGVAWPSERVAMSETDAMRAALRAEVAQLAGLGLADAAR